MARLGTEWQPEEMEAGAERMAIQGGGETEMERERDQKDAETQKGDNMEES